MVRSEKLEAIGQVAGGVAHELRSPFGGIKNALYYLTTRLGGSEVVQSNPRISEFLQVIEDGVHHANKTISDLLVLSRVDRVSPLAYRHNPGS